jgi:signal transduction histidine kinase
MKRAAKACWSTKAALLSLAMALLVLWSGVAAAVATAAAPAASEIQVTQAELRVQTGAAFAPPPWQLDNAALNALAAMLTPDQTTVTLPYTWPRMIVPKGDASAQHAVRTTWLQIDLPRHWAQPGGTWLYLPRWQTIGQIAVYGDDRLLYRSHADLVWNGFNHPLLVPLDGDGTLPLPTTLRIRIDSQASAGGAVSSLWVGSAAALQPRHSWRLLLQTRLPELSGIVVLGVGVFALLVWVWGQRERAYLLFAVFALVGALRGLHYYIGLEPLPIPSAWFGWMTVNAVTVMLVVWYYFVATLLPPPPQMARWPGRALLGLLLVSATATLPPLAVLPGMDVLAPMTYLVAMLAAVPSCVYLVWLALRQGKLEGLCAALIGVLDLCIATHDWLMQNYFVGPEDFYYGALAAAPRLLMFVYVVLSRYVGVVVQAEQANVQLAQRLQAREAQLAESFEKLRVVAQHQALQSERQRLMQDIHDGMGSQLMSALHVAEAGHLSSPRMAQVLRECIEDLKLTVDSFDPAESDLPLLLATLRSRLVPRLEGSGLQLIWEVADGAEVPALGWLDPRSALHVLRILQESISNVIRHAGASVLRVETGLADGGVLVQITDNGVGFDARTHAALPHQDGHSGAGKGLSNMLRRAHAVGAEVGWTVLDEKTGGTCFKLWLPLHKGAERVPKEAVAMDREGRRNEAHEPA